MLISVTRPPAMIPFRVAVMFNSLFCSMTVCRWLYPCGPYSFPVRLLDDASSRMRFRQELTLRVPVSWLLSRNRSESGLWAAGEHRSDGTVPAGKTNVHK